MLSREEQHDWDIAKRRLAEIRAFSRDPRTKVGAVIVAPGGVLIGEGCNRFAVAECETAERWASPAKSAFVIHAEEDAIATAHDLGCHPARGTMFVSTLFPCARCANALARAGIAKLFAVPPDYAGRPDWADQWRVAEEILAKRKITVKPLPGDFL